MTQAEIDQANAAFWSEVCGTSLAMSLRRPTIANFDRAYLAQYPWLERMVAELVRPGDDVLEVGPGYGTVGRMLVARGVNYQAIDIAPGVIEHTKAHTSPYALRANVLNLHEHFDPESFDSVVAIGCLHHTGNLPRAIEQVHGVLRPGGKLLAMVYGEGDTKDFHLDGTPAPHTDITEPAQAASLFAAFAEVAVEQVSPHGHLDLYITARK